MPVPISTTSLGDVDSADPSPVLEELESNDFPSYFSERGERLFPAGDIPYPLPVDTPEQQRLSMCHRIFKRLFGENWIGPVGEVLAHVPTGHKKMVLDVCTGKGEWVMEMAERFPSVHFRGIDIVPIATRYPLPNAQFEIQDVRESWRWEENKFDVVHARLIAMTVTDYNIVLNQACRVLRSGGIFLSYEWGRCAVFDHSYLLDPAIHAPASTAFYEALSNALRICRNLYPIADRIPSLLEESHQFTEITAAEYRIPIGSWSPDPVWRELGRDHLEMRLRFAQSVKPLFSEAGWTSIQVEQLVTAYGHELQTVRGLVGVLYTVHAKRL